ncbi:MAG: 3-hydroxyacyl-CoA dehydrogenase NAD-binding domain-containing protein [Gemmatimonadota bacterium]|nr:3-hydroxyacyl-CoA dehydrogenase NAD-binding domain-containing protein [Gemmatimonadota bacterium]
MSAFTTHTEHGVGWLEFDLPNEPINKITRGVRDELHDVLDRLGTDGDVRSIVLISRKPDSFIAGADIDEFVALKSRDEAHALVRSGQELLNRLERLGKPIVAAIHGACLGGGFETALACDYRIATDHPKTRLGLPEVQLGIIPAAGGCQRLPRLIGVRAALDMILTGKQLSAWRAYRQGFVDDLVHSAILDRVAHEAATRLAGGWRPKRRRFALTQLALDRNPLGRRVVYATARKQVLKKTGGHYPAPVAALRAVEHGFKHGVDAGLDIEASLFAELAIGDVSRNLVRIFFATTALKKDWGVAGEPPAPKPVTNVGIVGAGFMGSAIGSVAVSQAHVSVRLRDRDVKSVGRGLTMARGMLRERLEHRRIDKYEFRRMEQMLSGTAGWEGFRRADVVIEAVFEDLGVKHEVLRGIAQNVREDCVIASNTSTIPIGKIATAVERPERVLGMHFFSPVEKMPLLEVIVSDKTAPWATVTAVALGREMGKTVIVVGDAPGFWVNRLLAPYLNEAGRLLEEGVTVEAIDRAMTRFGFPVGPITLLDEVGLDVVDKGSNVLFEAFGDRMKPMAGLARLIEDGRLGRKNGRGFFTYEGGVRREVDQTAYEIIGAAPDSQVPREYVEARLIFAMLNEAARALDERVVGSPRNGDIGAVFGIGFPAFRGGPLRYVSALGVPYAVETLQELTQKYGDRFTPCPRLTRMAAGDQSFYPAA